MKAAKIDDILNSNSFWEPLQIHLQLQKEDASLSSNKKCNPWQNAAKQKITTTQAHCSGIYTIYMPLEILNAFTSFIIANWGVHYGYNIIHLSSFHITFFSSLMHRCLWSPMCVLCYLLYRHYSSFLPIISLSIWEFSFLLLFSV